MASKKKFQSKNSYKTHTSTPRAPRPQQPATPHRARVTEQFRGEGVTLRSMPDAVEYLSLMEKLGKNGVFRLTALPIYRMTKLARDEALEVFGDSIAGAELDFDISDLPHDSGVILFEDAAKAAGMAWRVASDGVVDLRMLPARQPFYVRWVESEYTFQALGEMPSFRVVQYDQSRPSAAGGKDALRVLHEARAVLARLIVGGAVAQPADESVSSNNNTRPGTSRYEVRTLAECATGRQGGGGHAGWHLTHKSHTRGHFRKNGTWVEGYVRGANLPERPRIITGTTIRAGVAA